MRTPHILLSSVLVILALAGCSGGSAAFPLQVTCANKDPFCITSCDLGCSQGGNTCSITEIAENQKLRFFFSKPVDAASVNGSSFSIRSASGQSPAGSFVVAGSQVTFEPRVQIAAGTITFGFARGETYLVTVAGGSSASQGVRSVTGDTLTREFSCSVSVTLGIIDEDQSPPVSELVAPTTTTNVPVDATFVIRFSELIDPAPFNGSAATAPIQYLLQRSHVIGGNTECDTIGAPIHLDGLPHVTIERVNGHDVSVVSLTPNIQLPGSTCVTISVTSDVRDLSGRQAIPADYHLFITSTGVQSIDQVETFASPARMDPLISSGSWSNGAHPGTIGGDGRHGSFNIANGANQGNGLYIWNLDTLGGFVIPASQTLDGNVANVTDGKFFFTDFTLPAGSVLRFTGSIPPKIYVRGQANIAGKIDVNAAAMTTFTAHSTTTTPVIPGQPGGLPGPGGGRGGNGAQRCIGAGPVISGGVTLTNGQPGIDVRLPSGNAYLARAVGTAGQGGTLWPSTGLTSAVTFTLAPGGGAGSTFCGQFAPGGAGGGFWIAGTQANVPVQAGVSTGPFSPAGIAIDLFPVIPGTGQPGENSLNHFLVGGSGGGGGGSHPLLGLGPAPASTDCWKAGGAGSGGGGACAIRSGNDLTVATTGRLESKGGAGVVFNSTVVGAASPGGGGSGGSFLLQSGANLTVQGAVDTSGGIGSSISLPSPFIATGQGGTGSPGIYRFEAINPPLVNATTLVPAFDSRLVATLTDFDSRVGCASVWRSTGRIFQPEWVRYVLEVDVDGDGIVDSVYTDDPSYTLPPGTPGQLRGPANDPTGAEPVRVRFQGAQVSGTGVPTPGTAGPWRDFVHDRSVTGTIVPSLNVDSATGHRFLIDFNRTAFPTAVVKKLTVTFRA